MPLLADQQSQWLQFAFHLARFPSSNGTESKHFLQLEKHTYHQGICYIDPSVFVPQFSKFLPFLNFSLTFSIFNRL